MRERKREQVIQELAGATARRMSLVELLVGGSALGRRLHAHWQEALATRFARSFAAPAELGAFLRDRCIEIDFEVCDLSHSFQSVIRDADDATLARWYEDAFREPLRIV